MSQAKVTSRDRSIEIVVDRQRELKFEATSEGKFYHIKIFN